MPRWTARLWIDIGAYFSNFRGRYFYRLIWLGMVSACVPVLLAGIVYYHISVGHVYEKALSEGQVTLKLVSDRVERILNEVESKSLQLALNPLVTEAVSELEFNEKEIVRMRLLNVMYNLQATNDFITDIVLYDLRSKSMLSANHGYMPVEQFGPLDGLDTAMNSAVPAQWLAPLQAGGKDNVAFVHKLPHMKKNGVDGLLIFRVDTRMLEHYLQDNTFQFPNKSVVVLDSENNSLLSINDRLSEGETAAEDPSMIRIRTAEQKSDAFLGEDARGEEFFYFYQKIPSSRTYISSIPETDISKQLVWIRWFTIWILLLFILVGILLTIVTAMRAYSPIQQLIKHGRSLSLSRVSGFNRNELGYLRECMNFLNQERSVLSSYLSGLQPSLRERLFQKLLQNGHMDNAQLQKECGELHIPVDSHYIVMVVEVENIHKEKRFSIEDKAILSFSLTNVMSELLEGLSGQKGYVLSFNEGNAIAVLSGCDLKELANRSHRYALSIHEAMKTYMKLQVSIGIGSAYPHIADAGVSYQEALTALQNRMYMDSGPIFYIEALDMTRKQKVAFYPSKEEATIIDAIGVGDLQTARQALLMFAHAVRQSHSYPFVYQTYHLLLASLIRTVEQQGGNLLDVLEHNLFDQMKERKTTMEICDWFSDVCFPLLFRALSPGDQVSLPKAKTDILRICDYIKENIHSDISLTNCAEMVSLTPSYVSRLFKKVMGFSFVDYVVHCKVEEAKRLLIETDRSIGEIAASIGYSERNLNRLFHRLTDFTPGQFRTRYR